MPRTRIATFVLCGLCALALVPGAVAVAIHPDDVEISYGEGIAFLVGAVAIASVPLVAALLVSRHVPGNVIGPLLAAEAFVVVATGSTSVYGYAAEGGGLPAFTWVVGSMQGAWMTLFIPFALLVLFFPDGRLPGPRWRVVPVGLAVVFVLFELGAAFTPHSYEEPWQDLDHPHSPMLQFVAMAMLPAFLVLLAACVISIFRRFRRADPVQRHQIRWLQLVSAAVPLALLLSWLTYLLLGDTGVTQVVFVVMLLAMFIAVPIAVTIAVTRHDLYERGPRGRDRHRVRRHRRLVARRVHRRVGGRRPRRGARFDLPGRGRHGGGRPRPRVGARAADARRRCAALSGPRAGDRGGDRAATRGQCRDGGSRAARAGAPRSFA
jgi:hypothetical protein